MHRSDNQLISEQIRQANTRHDRIFKTLNTKENTFYTITN